MSKSILEKPINEYSDFEIQIFMTDLIDGWIEGFVEGFVERFYIVFLEVSQKIWKYSFFSTK